MSAADKRSVALAELAPTGNIRVAMNVGNAATVSRRGDALVGPAPRLAAALGAWTCLPVSVIAYKSAGEVLKAAAGDAWDVAFLAVDAARSAFHFTPPYLSIQAIAVVRTSSPLHDVRELDAAGVRIASSAGAAYDLVLQRVLRNATRTAFEGPQASFAGFDAQGLDAVVGIRETVEKAFAGRADVRPLQGVVATIDHALATPVSRTHAAALLDDFVRTSWRALAGQAAGGEFRDEGLRPVTPAMEETGHD
ncbi:MAG TPA: transporter substrate-binding domain-containing protein [Allosphingosinicella sp.]|nr:transporter substrate-binding domain-containing protein [Allosphingosinicella sp.]